MNREQAERLASALSVSWKPLSRAVAFPVGPEEASIRNRARRRPDLATTTDSARSGGVAEDERG